MKNKTCPTCKKLGKKSCPDYPKDCGPGGWCGAGKWANADKGLCKGCRITSADFDSPNATCRHER